ncbi:unnamed protein product [Strongylus vulgaris]|uniref:Uncharacterized protein n=1 Tax=Strongylus vulgaris TaxID=40348 RepID=A0A3P7JBW6_STRVU|nr:unnamed protein product [Strongylus vulgaris]
MYHRYYMNMVIALDVVNDPSKYGGMMAYSRSKLAQVMYTRHLATIIESKKLPVNVTVCHPGGVDTNILQESGYQPIMWFVLKTDDDGAQMPIFLALSEKVHKSNGQYFKDFVVTEVPEKCQDRLACKKLYEESRKAVGLD